MNATGATRALAAVSMLFFVAGCSDASKIEDSTDSDGDGLPDTWELYGADVDGDGTIDVNLPAMGADPRHKDVFLELDWMEVAGPGGHSDAWLPGALQLVEEAFLAAPVNNPDGRTGIVLHIDAGPDSIMDRRTSKVWGQLSRAAALEHETGLTSERELQIRAIHQDPARQRIFRYGIAGHDLASVPNPQCQGEDWMPNGVAVMPGSQLIVTQGVMEGGLQTQLEGYRRFDETAEAGLLMHELGHTLGLGHGGHDQVNRKPNYLSVMNYSFLYRGVKIGGQYGHIDYSRFGSVPLDEAALNEQQGLAGLAGPGIVLGTTFFCRGATTLCSADVAAQAANMVEVDDVSQPIDWNCNGTIDAAPVSANINIETPGERLEGQNDWQAIDYSAGGYIGPVPSVPATSRSALSQPSTPLDASTRRAESAPINAEAVARPIFD